MGGGIAGLSCAYYLARSGYTPVVLEPSSELGGRLPQIDHEGLLVDRVDCSILSTDTAVCGLLAEFSALGRLTWRPTQSGILLNDRAQPLSSVRDVVRVSGLSLADRVRFAAGLVYATRLRGYRLHLNEIRAVDWLPRVFGSNIFESHLRPLLELRYGEYADEIPAYPLWQGLRQLHGQSTQVAGHIRGGPRWLAEKLRRAIEELGGEVRLHAQITGVDVDSRGGDVEVDGREQRFGALISTLTPAALAKLARGRLARLAADVALPHQGKVVALAILSRPLSRYHQTFVVDAGAPFSTIQEATRVIPSRQCGGKHLVYLTRFCDAASEGYELSDDVVRKQVVESLVKCYRDFDPDSIEAVHVTRIEEARPIFTVENLLRRKGFRANGSPFLACTPTQAYPRPAGWDAEITLAREVASSV